MFVGPRAQVKLKIILYWAGQDFLRAVLQSETFPTQTSFLSSLLSPVLDLLCGLKAFPAHSCSLFPVSFTGISPNKSLALLTLSWHLLPGKLKLAQYYSFSQQCKALVLHFTHVTSRPTHKF